MHSFIPVTSPLKKDLFFAECSISGHRILNVKTSTPRQFKTAGAVETFSKENAGAKLKSALFKECANALLVHHGARMICEDPCETGSLKTFSLYTRFGPALVTPVDTWVIFRFQETAGKSFPWGMSGTSGNWNFHSSGDDLGALLEDFADGLARCTSPSVGVQIAPTARVQLLPPTVMKSGAGWYVGCFCRTEEGEYPHSRYSDYFPKPQLAQHWLDTSLASGSL